MNHGIGSTYRVVTRLLPVTAALIMESKAVWEFFHPYPGAVWMASVLSLHGLAAVLFALQPPHSGPGPERGFHAAWSAFLFVFVFCIPGLGMAGLLLAVGPSLRRKRPITSAAYRVLSREPTREFSPTYPTRYGPGGFRSRLLSQSIPSPHRLQSLLALKARATPDGNRLIREVLRDPADELRLMAYGTLERREMDFQKAIAAAKSALAATFATPSAARREKPDLHPMPGEDILRERRRFAYRRLAFLHWEMTYQELAEGELAQYYLAQALAAADQALALNAEDGELKILKGRILARMGNWDLAWQTLSEAETSDGQGAGMLPHRAELAFMRGDFVATRNLLAQVRETRGREYDVPKALEPVLRFWLGKPR